MPLMSGMEAHSIYVEREREYRDRTNTVDTALPVAGSGRTTENNSSR